MNNIVAVNILVESKMKTEPYLIEETQPNTIHSQKQIINTKDRYIGLNETVLRTS